MSEFIDLNIVNDIRPYDKEAKKERPWFEKSGMKGAPHQFRIMRLPDGKPVDNVLDAIGGTPMVKLNKIPQSMGIECNIYAKMEFLNPGGSTKDRVAERMVDIAERTNILRPGMTLIEPTSGNTGIGLSMVAAVKGYKCLVVMTDKISKEKESIINTLGTKTIRTPDDAPYDTPQSHIGVAFQLREKNKNNTLVLDQYINPANPIAHYESTAAEILHTLDNKVDMVVMGAGTGGSITGIGRRMKEECKNIKIIGADPEGSVIGSGEGKHEGGFFEVEGIGYHFVPATLDFSAVDKWIKVNDMEAFNMARRLIREEGLLVGGSSGSIMFAALQECKKLQKGQNCVIILPDGIRNYLSKFISDNWMLERKFMEKIERTPIKPSENSAHEPITYRPDKDPNTDESFVPLKTMPVESNAAEDELTKHPKKYRKKLLINNALEAIGNTPLVRLNRLPEIFGVKCQVYVKCEYLNPSGSIKDRIARRMIELAEKDGRLKPGMTIIQPTSGNSGIALAMAATIKGYRCIIVMPEEMSSEKENTLLALGAVVIRSSANAPFSDPTSHIGVAVRLQKELSNSIILDQYTDIGNPLVHYEETAEEILFAMDNDFDMFVAGAGTGGTLTGVGRKLKEICPKSKIVAANPIGSILVDPSKMKPSPSQVEDIGCDFVPAVMDRQVVDQWVQSTDKESFEMARKIASYEGILCGGSAGCSVACAMKAAKNLNKNQKCVVMLEDGITYYMTKFLNDEWMKYHNYNT